MARFQLGSIITQIAGSIGGTTFRRSQNGHVMYNKQGSQIKSAFAPKSRKNELAGLLSSWSRLDNETQEAWINAAANIQFPDKFGTYRNLTGRQLYTKLNAQLMVVNETVDMDIYNTYVPPILVTDIELNLEDNSCILEFSDTVVNTYLLVSVYQSNPIRPVSGSEVLAPGIIVPRGNFQKTVAVKLSTATTYNMWNAVLNQFPYFGLNYSFGVNVQFMNDTGYRTPVQSFSLVNGVV
jgi:hypothetical protein